MSIQDHELWHAIRWELDNAMKIFLNDDYPKTAGRIRHLLKQMDASQILGLPEANPKHVDAGAPTCPVCGITITPTNHKVCPLVEGRPEADVNAGHVAIQNELQESVRDLLRYINDTPRLLSLLYDIDMTPEQLKEGTSAWINMLTIADWFRENAPSVEPKATKSADASGFSQTPTSLETGGRNAPNLQRALEHLGFIREYLTNGPETNAALLHVNVLEQLIFAGAASDGKEHEQDSGIKEASEDSTHVLQKALFAILKLRIACLGTIRRAQLGATPDVGIQLLEMAIHDTKDFSDIQQLLSEHAPKSSDASGIPNSASSASSATVRGPMEEELEIPNFHRECFVTPWVDRKTYECRWYNGVGIAVNVKGCILVPREADIDGTCILYASNALPPSGIEEQPAKDWDLGERGATI